MAATRGYRDMTDFQVSTCCTSVHFIISGPCIDYVAEIWWMRGADNLLQYCLFLLLLEIIVDDVGIVHKHKLQHFYVLVYSTGQQR